MRRATCACGQGARQDWPRRRFHPIAFPLPMDLPATLPTSQVVTIVMIGLIPVCVTTLKLVLDIITWFRKSPPIHEVYATKEEMVAMEGRLVGEIKEHGNTTETVEKRLNDKISEFNSQLVHQLDQGQTLFASIQKELNSLASATAELRGKLSAITKR